MLNIIVAISLGIYLIELGRQIDRAMNKWPLRKIKPAIGHLTLITISINAVFFVITCVGIYQLLFDMQPNTYNNVSQLLIFCVIDMIVDMWITSKFE